MRELNFIDDPSDVDDVGALAYTPLIHKLKEWKFYYTCIGRWDKIVCSSLEFELPLAMESDRHLQYIKDVAENYPELIPEILLPPASLHRCSSSPPAPSRHSCRRWVNSPR